MSSFNPDAYLAKTDNKAQGFDPDAYLSQTSSPASTTERQPIQVLPDFIWNRLSDEQKRRWERSMAPSYQRGEGSGSFIAGAVEDLPLGIAQLGANIAGRGEGINQALKEREAQIQRGREQEGRGEGWDWQRILGGVASPLNIGIDKLIRTPIAAANPWKTSVAVGTGLAVAQPTTSGNPEQFWNDKASQATVGAFFGGASPIVLNVVTRLGQLGYSFTGAGQKKALAESLNELAGPDRDAVIKSLQDATEFVKGSRPTAAEVLADLPSAIDLVRKQAQLARQPGLSGKFEVRTTENQAARIRDLQRISGTEAQRTRLAQTRDRVTGQMRETALNQADLAGPIYTKLEQDVMGKFNSVAAAEQTAGMVGLAARQQQGVAQAGRPGWLTAGDRAQEAATRAGQYGELAQTLRQNARLKQLQLDSLEQNGFFPLRASDIAAQIDARIRNTVNDESKAILTAMRNKVLSKADENGIVSSRELYENIRKPANAEIAKLLGYGDQYASGGLPKQAAKAVGDVKGIIDGALNQSSEGLWSKYLKNYQRYSIKLDRMEVGNYLLDKLRQPGVADGDVGLNPERMGAFAAAVENAPNTIKRSTGQPRFEKLSDILTPKEVQSVRNVLSDVSRQQQALKKGQGPAAEAGVVDVASKFPPWFSTGVTILKTALGSVQDKNNTKFNKALTDLMLEPKQMAQLMSSMSPENASLMGKLMYRMADEQNRNLLANLVLIPSRAREVTNNQEAE
jgi:hypothetical protein